MLKEYVTPEYATMAHTLLRNKGTLEIVQGHSAPLLSPLKAGDESM